METGAIMAGETTGGVHASGDDLLDGYAGGGRCHARGIVTHGAGVLMYAEDTCPGVGKLVVAGIASLPLGEIDASPLTDGMGVEVAGKTCGVTGVALAGAIDCRALQAAVAWMMAGSTAQKTMDLVRCCTDEG